MVMTENATTSTVVMNWCTVAAPLALFSYGVLRLLGSGMEPGGPWVAGHVAFLLALILFVPVVLLLARRGRGLPLRLHRVRQVVIPVTLVGLAAGLGQVVVDLIVGLRAADHAGMKAMFADFRSHPAATAVFYTVGPALFYVGLPALVMLLAAAGRVPLWSPVLVLVASVLPLASLDLLPLAGAGYLAGLAPALWDNDR